MNKQIHPKNLLLICSSIILLLLFNANSLMAQSESSWLRGKKPTPVFPMEMPAEPVITEENATTISFEETVFDFGEVKEGESVTHIFKFKNSGSKPLTIFEARGSCGCTVPEYPREPIAPGASAELKVVFNSKGKKGMETKYVTLNANTIPMETRLTIKANVILPEVKN